MSSLPLLCGTASTVIFVVGTLPMLVKAFRTRDLSSYSLGHLTLNNAGNALNTVYIVTLPVGPVWALHGFNVVVTALMLLWYLRFSSRMPAQEFPHLSEVEMHSSPEVEALIADLASSDEIDGVLVG